MAVSERRIAVVGLGSIGRRHARLLRDRAGVKVELVEANADALSRAQQELGLLRAHDTFEKMLKTRPDAVWIATPPQAHVEQTVQAVEAGAHVFCEKPMSTTLAEGLRMRDAAHRHGRIINIGFVNHFHPGLRRIRELISTDQLGMVLHVHSRMGAYVILKNSISRYQSRLPGSLFLDCTHQADAYFWLTGQIPTEISTVARESGRLELSSNPNLAVVTCEYESPMISTIHLNFVQSPIRQEYEIVGDRGWVHWDCMSQTLRIGRTDAAEIATESVAVEDVDDLYRAEHQAFFNSIDGKRAPETSAEDGLASMAMCDAMIQSYESGGSTCAVASVSDLGFQ
ncbi:MAG: Gfo/Idh/MocA family oxidoreductase [Pirellulales bacterium]|nr:Gfo/Idh/MocA family oxidoreductase [Pirellulales bacterium]